MAASIGSFPNSVTTQTPYPGEPAVFKVDREWTQFYIHDHLLRSLEFVSDTPNALCTAVKISGYRDKSIMLMITFPKKDQEVKNFFSMNGLYDDSNLHDSNNFNCGLLCVKTPAQRQRLFTILDKNNTFPEDKIKFARALIQAQTWDQVPQQVGEVIPEKPCRRARPLSLLRW